MSAALRASTLLRHGLFFLGLALVFLLLTSFVFDAYTNYNVTEVAIYAICAAGLTVLTGINGQVSLGHGALMMIGAYTTSVLLTWHNDLPLILVVFLAVSGLLRLAGISGSSFSINDLFEYPAIVPLSVHGRCFGLLPDL